MSALLLLAKLQQALDDDGQLQMHCGQYCLLVAPLQKQSTSDRFEQLTHGYIIYMLCAMAAHDLLRAYSKYLQSEWWLPPGARTVSYYDN